jgi:tetratricopeptide (TPR) repeat protein
MEELTKNRESLLFRLCSLYLMLIDRKPNIKTKEKRMIKMNVSHQALAQNNLAVTLIEAGNYQYAISNLSDALATYKEIMINTSSTTSNCALKTNLDECMANQSSSSGVNDDISTMLAGFFLYENGIAIPSELIGTTYADTILVCCIIIFNLALAQHLHFHCSKLTRTAHSKSLHKAVRLYELAFQLQRETDLENNTLFTLAIVNNIGLAHRQLLDGEAALKCFEFVLSILMYLTDCGYSEMFVLEGFFLNIFDLISPLQSAPAA